MTYIETPITWIKLPLLVRILVSSLVSNAFLFTLHVLQAPIILLQSRKVAHLSITANLFLHSFSRLSCPRRWRFDSFCTCSLVCICSVDIFSGQVFRQWVFFALYDKLISFLLASKLPEARPGQTTVLGEVWSNGWRRRVLMTLVIAYVQLSLVAYFRKKSATISEFIPIQTV